MNMLRNTMNQVVLSYNKATSGSRTALALDSAYVHRTSGDVVAVRYMAQVAGTIDELYIFMDDYQGTLGNISMQCDIYNESVQTKPGTTLRDSSTTCTMPDAVDKWIKFTFGTPYTTTVGEILWLVCYNTAAAPTTDYPSILVSGTLNIFSGLNATGYSATAGFSSNGTLQSELSFVIKHGSDYIAQPFTQVANVYASSSLQRGVEITPVEDLVVGGAEFSPSASLAWLRILKSTTSSGTPIGAGEYEYDLDSDTGEKTSDVCGAKVFDSPVTLLKGQTYHVILTYTGNLALPGIEIEDYASYSAMFDTIREYNDLTLPYGVIDDMEDGWTVNKAISPQYPALIVSSFPAIDTPSASNVVRGDTVRGVAGTAPPLLPDASYIGV